MAEYIIKHKQPAQNNGEAVPVTNGRIGAMIYGNPVNETIKINLDGFWSGKPCNRINNTSKDAIAEVRDLINKGETSEAEKLATEKMQATPSNTRRFMPLLELHINSFFNGKPRNYIHKLDTSTSVSALEFDVETAHFVRTAFCTGNEGLITGFLCDKDKSISFDAWLDGREEFCAINRVFDDKCVIYIGGIGGSAGINFTSGIAVKSIGGTVEFKGNRICVRDADFVMLVFNGKTDIGAERFEEHQQMIIEDILASEHMDYDTILKNHTEWYKSVFNRVSLSLDSNINENLDNLSTDERITRLKGDVLDTKECTRLIHDNRLIELYFNFGRYLMITGGTLNVPLNIKGIWNDDPDSDARYILSGSMQMCYWCADVLNIGECITPFFNFIDSVCKSGEQTAKNMYGIPHGSIAHTASDVFGDSMPNGTEPESFWTLGLAWLAIHIYEYYEYTMDKEILSSGYKSMKKAAEFFVDYLVEDEKGYLVVSPAVIPTIEYINEKGAKAKFGKGASVDAQILRVLFTCVIKASRVLETDTEFAGTLSNMLERLPEIEVGKYGQIKAWTEDYEIVDSENNILYQLFGLHPADLITPSKTPKLADASRTTLVRRLIHSGLDKGWGCAWTANMWARLYDGDMVYENIKNILTRSTSANLINNCPDFSIDVNLGIVSAIAESLIQSTNGEIVILPALPKEWSNGSVSGLKAKGGFEISIAWKDGKLESAEIFSKSGQECRLRFLNTNAVSIISDDESIDSRIEDGVIIFKTKENTTYAVRC